MLFYGVVFDLWANLIFQFFQPPSPQKKPQKGLHTGNLHLKRPESKLEYLFVQGKLKYDQSLIMIALIGKLEYDYTLVLKFDFVIISYAFPYFQRL